MLLSDGFYLYKVTRAEPAVAVVVNDRGSRVLLKDVRALTIVHAPGEPQTLL